MALNNPATEESKLQSGHEDDDMVNYTSFHSSMERVVRKTTPLVVWVDIWCDRIKEYIAISVAHSVQLIIDQNYFIIH